MVIRLDDKLIDNIPLGVVAKSNLHGIGLFAQKTILKNQVIGLLTGKLMHWNDVKKMGALRYVEMEWNAITEGLLMVREQKTKYAAINHSRAPNIKIDRESRGRNMPIYAIKDIHCGEELLLDYRDEPLPLEYIKTHGAWYI